MLPYLRCVPVLLALFVIPALAEPPQANTTDVLVMVSAKPDVERDRIMKVMPEEIRATVRLYLDGKIRQWYSRSDGRGVVFILSSKDVDEARSVMEGLPLSKHKFVNLEFIAMSPLKPLGLLLDAPRHDDQPSSSAAQQQPSAH
jgi:hypothetical protein